MSMDPDLAHDRVPTEKDVAEDSAVAQSRATGGDPADTEGDAVATTGTGDSDEFVGRVSGQDAGYVGLTGAEARAISDDETLTSDD